MDNNNNKKEKLTENKEFMDVMQAAGNEDYSAAAKKIERMEQNQTEQRQDANADDYVSDAQKLMESYLEKNNGVKINYDLRPEELGRALRAFQKKTIYKKNIIYSVLLGLISVCFCIDMLLYPNRIINFIVTFGCLVIIFMLWNLPRRHIKSVEAASAAVSESFSAYVCGDCMFAGEAPGKITHIPYSKKTFAIKNEDGIILGVDRERLFLFPRRCMENDDINKLEEILRGALSDRFENKNEVRKDG